MWKLLQLLLPLTMLIGCYLGTLPSSVQEEQSAIIPKAVHDGFKLEICKASLSRFNSSTLVSDRLKNILQSFNELFAETPIQVVQIDYKSGFDVYLKKRAESKTPVRLSSRKGVTLHAPMNFRPNRKLEDKIYSAVNQIENYFSDLNNDPNSIEDFFQLWPLLSLSKHHTKISVMMPNSRMHLSSLDVMVKERLDVEFLSHNKAQLSGVYFKHLGEEEWSPLVEVELKGDAIELSFIGAKSETQKFIFNRKLGAITPLASKK